MLPGIRALVVALIKLSTAFRNYGETNAQASATADHEHDHVNVYVYVDVHVIVNVGVIGVFI